MHRARIALPVLLGGIVALWGCTPPPQSGSAEKSLETRVAKLEKELKAAQEQATALSAQVRVEQARTKDVTQERDDARTALKSRTDELGKTSGDLAKAHGELDAVRKGLKDLLGRVDSALAPLPGKSAGTDVSALPAIELK
jgi:chromosome segregation ATPase